MTLRKLKRNGTFKNRFNFSDLGISGSLNLKKILLLGSGGFLGTNLRDYFEVNYSSEYKLINVEGKDQLDIKNFDLFNDFIAKNKPEIIINAAAFVGGIAYGSKFPAKILHDNSQIGLNIYESARLNNIEKVINPISNCAYPGDASLYKEESFGMENHMILFLIMDSQDG